jgi:hypothetical protein
LVHRKEPKKERFSANQHKRQAKLYNKEEHSGLKITGIKSGRESWNKVLL